MGYYLLYESMLDTVLYARDRWLISAGSGLILPDKASIKLAVLEDKEYRESKIDFWNNVYGLKMTTIRELALREPLVDVCDSKQVISTTSTLFDIDIYTVKAEELDFTANYQCIANQNDYVYGIVCWFDVTFSKLSKPVYMSTGPHDRYTHWKSTVFYINEPQLICKNDRVTGTITTKRNQHNHRDLDITVSMDIHGIYPYHMDPALYRLR